MFQNFRQKYFYWFDDQTLILKLIKKFVNILTHFLNQHIFKISPTMNLKKLIIDEILILSLLIFFDLQVISGYFTQKEFFAALTRAQQ